MDRRDRRGRVAGRGVQRRLGRHGGDGRHGKEEAADIEGGLDSEFFSQEEMDAQLAMRDIEAEGPADAPWEQAIEPEWVDTAQFAQPGGGWKVCFSNAATDNPWRQVGWTTMQAEVELHPEIAEFTALDAEASDDKQISDIESLAGRAVTR